MRSKLFILLVIIIYGLRYFFTHGELGGKPIYANLQAISEESRYNPPYTMNNPAPPVFIRKAFKYFYSGYDVLGIPTGDSLSPYFWIVTNTHANNDPSSPEDVCYVTSGRGFKLSCGYLNALIEKDNIDLVVEEFLKNRCVLP
ncbi:TPA: hypothetical protein ACJG01_004712 [Salmonella enterica subsp. salamae serovar 21:z10:[z6]]